MNSRQLRLKVKTPLPTAALGTTGMQITRTGFGAWAIGGSGWSFGWGRQDDTDSIAAIARAQARHQLDRHRRRLRPRTFQGGGRERVAGHARDRAALRLHQNAAWYGTSETMPPRRGASAIPRASAARWKARSDG
jgi:hypothetical protein